MDNPQGVLITKIDSGSPADVFGLHAANISVFIDNRIEKIGGDVIIKVDDTSISNKPQFESLINNKRVGENLSLSILRDEQIKIVNMTVSTHTNIIFKNASSYADPKNVNFVNYEDMKSMIKIQKPMEWNIEKDEEVGKITFRAPSENLKDTAREFLRIWYSNTYENLDEAKEISTLLPNLTIHNEETVPIKNSSAKMIHYSYRDKNYGNFHGLKTVLETNGHFYILSFLAQPEKFDKYKPTILEMVKSFEILKQNYFEDFDLGIKMKYLSSWDVNKNLSLSDATYKFGDDIVFSPNVKQNSSFFKENFKVFVSYPYKTKSSAIEDYNKTIHYFENLGNSISSGNYPNFKLISSKSNMFKNIPEPLHNVTYSYGDPDFGKVISYNLITIQNDRLYSISYSIIKNDETMIPVISQIIDSIEFFHTNYFSDPDLGFVFQYPSYLYKTQNENNIALYQSEYDSSPILTLTSNVYNTSNSYDNFNTIVNKTNVFINSTFEEPIIADKIVYSDYENKSQTQIMTSYKNKINNDTYRYEITYSLKSEDLAKYDLMLKKIIESFKIIDYYPIDTKFTSYNPKNSSFKLFYPIGWTYSDFYDGYSYRYTALIMSDAIFNNEPPTLFIESYPVGNSSFYSFIQSSLEPISQNADFELIGSEVDSIGEKNPSYQIKYILGEEIYLTKFIQNIENLNVYVITYTYQRNAFYNFFPLIDKIIDSFKFTDFAKTIKNKFTGFKVGMFPIGLDVYPLNNTIYVANLDSNTISVINGSNDKITEDIEVFNDPMFVSVNKLNNFIYVAHPGYLSVINGKHNSVTDEIPISVDEPLAMSINEVSGKVYVADDKSKNVSVIDTNDNKEVYIISTNNKSFTRDIFGGIGISYDSVKDRLYVVNSVNSSIFIFNGEDNRKIDVIDLKQPNEHPYDIVVNSLTDKAYIIGTTCETLECIDDLSFDPNSSHSFLSEVDLSTGNEKKLTSGQKFAVLALHKLTNTLYVTDAGSFEVRIIDPSKCHETCQKDYEKIVPVDYSPTFISVNQETNKIYITSPGSNTVSKVDGSSKELIFGLTFDINPPNSAFISCEENNDKDKVRQFSDNDYISYKNGTLLKCTAYPKNTFSPLTEIKWDGLDPEPPIEFVVTENGIVGGTFIDMSTLLQRIGPYISIFILSTVILLASIQPIYSKFRRIADVVKEETLSKTEIIGINASVIVGVLFFLTISEGFEISEQAQITIVTANIIFPFAISSILAIIDRKRYAIRLMIAGFINLMISVILIVIMRL